jgi:hypothetical protein
MPLILNTWKDEAGLHSKFKICMRYIMRLCLKKKERKKKEKKSLTTFTKFPRGSY